MKKYIAIMVIILMMLSICACNKQQSATNNNKLAQTQSTDTAESNNNASTVEGYDYNIKEDQKTFDADKIDIVVGDNYYATQINDWYANFNDYDGKTVEIEGYYIDSNPYKFVGRFGPSCPYCAVGYVAFEFFTNDDLSSLISGTDWIKVKGILRKGNDSSGEFYYIETMSIEKGAVGKDTVTN